MKVVVFTEGGKNIGFGHITRCLALSQVFKEKGVDVFFVVNGDDSVADFFLKEQLQIFDWIKEKDRLLGEVRGNDIIVIDSYLADKQVYDNISDITQGKVLMIDDYKRIDYPKGIVVNPSIYGESINYHSTEGVRYLLGKDYIILRKEFWNIPNKVINEKVKNILITFGGTNHYDLVNRIVNYSKNRFDFHFGIVDVRKNRFTAREMLNLMLKADICISAGGQTLNELARMGMPTIGVCFAENQRLNLEGWHELGFIEYAGRSHDKDLISNISKSIDAISRYEERLKRSKIGRTLVDSKGVSRIIKAVLN